MRYADPMPYAPSWRALAAVAVALILLVHPARAEDAKLDGLRDLALKLVNQSRSEHKLPALRLDAKLTKAAQSHADDMRTRNYYSHSSPEGKTVSDRFQAAGGSKWLLTAENIAKCDGCKGPVSEDYVRQLHDGWMHSPGHRANILHKGLERFGYGITVSSDGRLYGVQTFAGPGTPEGDGTVASLKPLNAREQAQAALDAINRRRSKDGLAALRLSDPLSSAARSMAPSPDSPDFSVAQSNDLYGALPKEQRNDWQTLSLVTGTCGGCGVQPARGDVEFFTQKWLESPRYAKMLLAKDITELGFAMAANGEGKKIALGLLGKRM